MNTLLQAHARSFRDCLFTSEQPLRFIEIYQIFLRLFEQTMHAFCELQGVQYAEMLEMLEMSYHSGRRSLRASAASLKATCFTNSHVLP